jgi:UDP-N-acetylmuramyl pentapeptide phosphotransferase/UDP-N-acetylglucosamine-1-phosphate transferase
MIDAIFTGILTFIALKLLLGTALRSLAIDQPGARSLHTTDTPRIGGLAIMSAVLLTWLFLGVELQWLLLPAMLLAISLLDDMRGVAVGWRLLTHVLVCALFLLINLRGTDWWVLACLLLVMVWMLNLYNFMDGADGLAGGMTMIGFSAYALAAYLAGDVDFAVMSFCIAMASLAFLLFNFHPARIFMGDCGAIPIGFLAAAMGLTGWQHGIWPLWFPLLVFSPFIVDATVTILKRILRGERVWQAHKTHYYQRLVQLGWGHKKTAIAEVVLMILTAGSALLLFELNQRQQAGVLLLWTLIYSVLMLLIDTKWRRFCRPGGS